jgi:hypothetical protein
MLTEHEQAERREVMQNTLANQRLEGLELEVQTRGLLRVGARDPSFHADGNQE